MRVCVFGPDLPAFEQKQLRLLAPVADGPDVKTVLLTNSRGRPPADGSHVHVTAGANTQVARYVPHTEILPSASLVITHAGFGTTMAARMPRMTSTTSSSMSVNARWVGE